MKFELEVGNEEKHVVQFKYNRYWGNLSISVDGKKVIGDLILISFETNKTYEFSVGISEVNNVVIEKTRPLVAPAFRNQVYRVHIDGKLVSEFEGY